MAADPVCTVCKKPVPRPERGKMGDFPFCSTRCKALDLSYWLDGSYVVPDDDWGDAMMFEPQDDQDNHKN